MKRFTISTSTVLALGLGLAPTLALFVISSQAAPVLSQVAGAAESYGTVLNAPAAELHVCLAGPPTCDYSTVQGAVDAASDGDVIKVATGIYTGVSARGGVTQVVYISKTVTIRGGYTTAFTDPPDPDANPTTLDAQGQGRVLYITGDPSAGPGQAISTTIEGLHITGGDSAGLEGGPQGGEAGGGVCVITATVTLSGCQVVTNTANSSCPFGGFGGGIYLFHSPNARLGGNVIRDNEAWYGGGVYLEDSPNATLSDNTIQANCAYGWYGASGGGMLLLDSPNATLSGNAILSNAAQDGGGVFLSRSDNATLSRNAVLSNTAMGSHTFLEGGGLSLWDSDDVTLIGNTIRGNVGDEGGGISLGGSDNAMLSGNTVQDNWGGLGGVNLYFSDNATLYNNVIADNQIWAWTVGGGIYVAGSTAHLGHTTLARNGGGSGLGVAPYWEAYSTVALTNTVLVSHNVGITIAAGNTVTLDGVLWYGNDANTGGSGTLTATRQITGDPAFAADGYHIKFASAALDAGVDGGITVDVDGEPRPAGAGYDIGADEFPAALSVTKEVEPDRVQPGAQLTYTLRATNTGSVDLNATITDTLPPGIMPGQTSGGTAFIPGGQIIWTTIITAPGGVWEDAVVVTVEEDWKEPLINLMEVTTEEGAAGDARVVVNTCKIYLPLVLRDLAL